MAPAAATAAPGRTVSAAATVPAQGFRAVGADGGVFDFGTNRYLGSLPRDHVVPAAPIVGMAATPDGRGYWLVGSDGGLFAFGDATFHGSLGGDRLGAPIVGIASAFSGSGSSGQGSGYWLVGRDGGVFAFDAPYSGSLPSRGLRVTDAIGLTPSVDNHGYWIALSDGAVYAFGSAPFIGDFQTAMAGLGDPNGTLDGVWTGLSTVAPPGAGPTLAAGQSVTLTFAQQPSPVQQGSPSTNPHYICPPVSVLATSGVTGAAVPKLEVTLTYSGANPGLYFDGQALGASGVTVETDSAGQATFGTQCASSGAASSGLGASNLGSGYRLLADAPDASAAITSDPFSVVQFKQTCTTDCSSGTLSSASTGTSATVQTVGHLTYDLIASFGLGPLECDSEVSSPPADPIVVQTTPVSSGASSYALVSLTFSKTVVNSLPDNGTPHMPVCAGATIPFPGSSYYPEDSYQYQGLLPACSSQYLGDPNQFCVVQRERDSDAGETVQVYVGAGFSSDPSFW